MRIALLPFDVSDEPRKNLDLVALALERCAAEGAELVVLPELWISSFAGDAAAIAARVATDAAQLEELRRHAEGLGVSFLGSALAPGVRAPRNRAHLAGKHGLQALGDKAHLFRLTGEHLAFERGDRPPQAAVCGPTRLGAAICYDLRFPEVARAAWRDGAELLCVTAQWGVARTKHLRALAIGRAVELQGHVVVVNRTGQSQLGGRVVHYGGEALVADPDGELLHERCGGAELQFVDIDLELARTRRGEVPVERDDAARSWQPAPERRAVPPAR